MSQIIFSFIPTAIATLLEPFWVLVGRYLALYQPYIELRRGNASPTSSLGLKYTNTPRALRHGHIFLFLASMMVITANILAVALGGIFDRSMQPHTSDIIVTYPFTTSINTEMQTVITYQGELVETFAKNLEEHWLIAKSNVVEGTELPAWVTDEFYFLSFEWGPGNMTGLRTSITQGYGGSLTCQLLAGNTFQPSQMGPTYLRINVTMPIPKEDSVGCWSTNLWDVQLVKPGIHPFAVEGVWGLEASNRSDQKAMQACGSLILAGWGRGEANQGYIAGATATSRNISVNMESSTLIICNQRISTGEFRVTVDGEGRVKRSKLIGELKYDDPRIFNHSTSVRNFTAQLAMLLRVSPRKGLDLIIMHNDNSTHSF